MKTLLAIALTLMITPAMARERAMVKLPIVYVMFGFQFLGAPDPNPGWFPMGAYDTKATCMAAEDEAYKSENIHRVSLKCFPTVQKYASRRTGLATTLKIGSHPAAGADRGIAILHVQ